MEPEDKQKKIQQKFKKEQKSSFIPGQISPDLKLYSIICKNSMLSLRDEIKLIKKHKKIMGALEDKENVKQLWMIKELKKNVNEIVHFYSDNVLTISENQVILQRGSSSVQQGFIIEETKQSKEIRVIRIKDYQGRYLTLNGILHVTDLNQNDSSQMFIIKSILPFQPIPLRKTYVIEVPTIKKCLDLFNADKGEGTFISCYQVNYRANQRWIFEPQISLQNNKNLQYLIKNYHSQKYLSIQKQTNTIVDSQVKQFWQLRNYHQAPHGRAQLFSSRLQKYLWPNENYTLDLLQKHSDYWLLNSFSKH